MPKIIPSDELTAIQSVIATQPGGIDAEGIRNTVGIHLPPRTLQRRLARLAAEGRIQTEGTGRGKKYFPARPERVGKTPSWIVADPPDVSYGSKRLSAGGKEVKQWILRPLSERTPVGYNPDFLEAYQPNQSAYLDEVLKAELAALGQIGQSARPAGTYLRQIMDRLIIDLSWNSSRLEGNTYSLLDTQLLLEAGQNADGKNVEETQMILNHKAAIEMLAEQTDEIGFNRYTVCNLHALLSENLIPDLNASGALRVKPVGITGTAFRPLAVPQKVEQAFDLMLQKADAITNPFEQAFFIMVHLPYLQPFEDVNKRTSRLAANIPLTLHNLCPLSFTDVDKDDYIRATLGVYEFCRVDYLRDVFSWAYRRSCARHAAIRKVTGEPDPFRLQYREQIRQHVQWAVNQRMDKQTAAKWISAQAEKEVPPGDRVRFIEVVELELCALHEGNIARYRLRPADFREWNTLWQQPHAIPSDVPTF
jgi:Fic family protein